MKRLLGALTIGCAFAVIGITQPAYVSLFQKKYGIKMTSRLGKASCALCHVGMSAKLNPYGADLKKAMGATKKLAFDALFKIEKNDSDGDGVNNAAEIRKDTLPGDRNSK